jgi:hypothetical protein
MKHVQVYNIASLLSAISRLGCPPCYRFQQRRTNWSAPRSAIALSGMTHLFTLPCAFYLVACIDRDTGRIATTCPTRWPWLRSPMEAPLRLAGKHGCIPTFDTHGETCMQYANTNTYVHILFILAIHLNFKLCYQVMSPTT